MVFESFLADCKQVVEVNGPCSTVLDINISVCQVSVLVCVIFDYDE